MAAGADVAEVKPSFTRADPLTTQEGICELCGDEYPTPWYAPNDLWNSVLGDGNGMLCPGCFMREANRVLGVQIWKVDLGHRPPARSTDEKSARALEEATKADPRPKTPPLYAKDGFDV